MLTVLRHKRNSHHVFYAFCSNKKLEEINKTYIFSAPVLINIKSMVTIAIAMILYDFNSLWLQLLEAILRVTSVLAKRWSMSRHVNNKEKDLPNEYCIL